MRFANERIAQLVDYISTPVSKMTRSDTDPYFYGMDESRWRQGQDKLHSFIQNSGRTNSSLSEELSDAMGVPLGEANAIVQHSRNPYNKTSRHVLKGMPQAHQTEMIARKALEASNVPVAFAHGNNHLATDLEVMVGKLHQYMDVQNRYVYPGNSDMMSLGVLQGLKNDSGQRAWSQASPSTSLEDIVSMAKDMSGGSYLPDKFYQERGLRDVPQDQVKDLLITSKYDASKVHNQATRKTQGYYNPTAPDGGMSVLDMNQMRDNMYPMSKKEILDLGGRPIQDSSKVKLQLPMNRLLELSNSPTSKGLISDEVNEALSYLSRQ